MVFKEVLNSLTPVYFFEWLTQHKEIHSYIVRETMTKKLVSLKTNIGIHKKSLMYRGAKLRNSLRGYIKM